MFNAEEFKKNVYELVTKEVNTVFSKILKGDKRALQKEGIKAHKQVMEILHFVTEETVTQILYGLLAHSGDD